MYWFAHKLSGMRTSKGNRSRDQKIGGSGKMKAKGRARTVAVWSIRDGDGLNGDQTGDAIMSAVEISRLIVALRYSESEVAGCWDVLKAVARRNSCDLCGTLASLDSVSIALRWASIALR